MDPIRAAAFAGRFACGLVAVAALAGVLALTVRGYPFLASLASGALTAGIFAFVRGAQPFHALALGAAAASFHLAALWHDDPRRALAVAAGHLVETGGVAASAVVFHLMAERGVRYGKFLLVGPMVALAFVAARPASLVGAPMSESGWRPLVLSGLIGLVVGDAVAAGLEVGEGLGRRVRLRLEGVDR